MRPLPSQDDIILSLYKNKKKTSKLRKLHGLKTLDAPNIINDFYLNLLDCDKIGDIAIALTNDVFLYDFSSGKITDFITGRNEMIRALKFNECFLGVATSNWTEIWDVTTNRTIRK